MGRVCQTNINTETTFETNDPPHSTHEVVVPVTESPVHAVINDESSQANRTTDTLPELPPSDDSLQTPTGK